VFGAENVQRVPDEIFRVVGFTAAEVPVVAGPRQGFGVSDFNGVANERRPGLCDSRKTQQCRNQRDGKPGRTNLLRFHGFF